MRAALEVLLRSPRLACRLALAVIRSGSLPFSCLARSLAPRSFANHRNAGRCLPTSGPSSLRSESPQSWSNLGRTWTASCRGRSGACACGESTGGRGGAHVTRPRRRACGRHVCARARMHAGGWAGGWRGPAGGQCARRGGRGRARVCGRAARLWRALAARACARRSPRVAVCGPPFSVYAPWAPSAVGVL